MSTAPIVHQRVPVGMKMFNQIIDVAPGGDRTSDVADVTAIEPVR